MLIASYIYLPQHTYILPLHDTAAAASSRCWKHKTVMAKLEADPPPSMRTVTLLTRRQMWDKFLLFPSQPFTVLKQLLRCYKSIVTQCLDQVVFQVLEL